MIKRFIPERAPDELEERLRLLRRGKPRALSLPKIRPLLRSRRWIILIVLLLLVLGASTVFLHMRGDGSPVNQAMEQQAGFPLYAPASLPNGLVYGSGLATISSGTVSYTIQSIDGAVAITEQALPSSVPDFSTMGLSASQVPAGTAYTGSTAGRSIGIVISKTTLISINADAAVPSAVVSKLSQSLKALVE